MKYTHNDGKCFFVGVPGQAKKARTCPNRPSQERGILRMLGYALHETSRGFSNCFGANGQTNHHGVLNKSTKVNAVSTIVKNAITRVSQTSSFVSLSTDS